MRMSRILVPLAAAVCGVIVAAAPTAAQPYPIGTPDITLSSGTVVVGNTVVLNGQHFGANDLVSIDATFLSTAMQAPTGRSGGEPAQVAIAPVAYTVPQMVPRAFVKSVRADANGNFTTTLVFDQAGVVRITATGDPSGVSLSLLLTILPAGAALPITGDGGGILGMILIGAAVVAAGAVLVFVTRRRRARVTA